jgi:hypothetical protein
VTSVGSGAGLTGGPITTSGTLSIATGGVSNAMLANPSLTVAAGTDLTGGGSVSLGNSTALNVDTTKIPQLAAANIFTGNQTVNGNLTATGVVSGSSFQIGSNLFAYGNYEIGNAFLGFAGNSTTGGASNTAIGSFALNFTMGYANTASGYFALLYDTTGSNNTASGETALNNNTTGNYNTASGESALYGNTTGSYNTAGGYRALPLNTTGIGNTGVGNGAGNTADDTFLTGSNNIALGSGSVFSTGTLTNATAIGANAEVSESNAMVLGSINGVNGQTASTNVGIGTTAPGHLLDVAGAVAFDSTGLNNGTNYLDLTFGLNSGEGMSSSRTAAPNQYGIDIFTDFTRRDSIEQHGNVGIGTTAPDSLLTVNGSADKPGGGSWATFSDGRLKTLDGEFNSGLSQVLKLSPVRYRYKPDNAMGIHDAEEHVGVVAQEVQQVIPEAVTENSKGYLLVNNDPIIWSMLNAIKEQQREIQNERAATEKQQQELRQQQTEMAKALDQIRKQQSLLRAQSLAMRSLQAEVRETRQTLRKVKE